MFAGSARILACYVALRGVKAFALNITFIYRRGFFDRLRFQIAGMRALPANKA